MNQYILLVEDDDDHAELAEFHINNYCDIEVVRLSDGEEAMSYIALLENNEKPLPWLVLLDLKIPKYDGHEILTKIKSSTNLLKCPVVMFTTSNSNKDIKKALDLKANSYILKPTELGMYGDVLEEMIDYWKLDQHHVLSQPGQ
ncbi:MULTISPECIES: response regulator [unclassified Neptuniibacter]|uniref:response regulator n=1 Tax=unclassified Neptuniibacter TaxID=2630693 RepID=UPI000C38F34D|nr:MULTISPECIES: response regulator [unclassified Neptuniibacter]MAY42299.1 hypothetical protein [Oceanospirillaceae bacterium]|tara:strand:- start:4404 stop:4835 length:432 start_codon:yes stop_codon:yes gene_type:complete